MIQKLLKPAYLRPTSFVRRLFVLYFEWCECLPISQICNLFTAFKRYRHNLRMAYSCCVYFSFSHENDTFLAGKISERNRANSRKEENGTFFSAVETRLDASVDLDKFLCHRDLASIGTVEVFFCFQTVSVSCEHQLKFLLRLVFADFSNCASIV